MSEREKTTFLNGLELITPEGAGYMPFFCSALWVASKGGVVSFDLKDLCTWRPAYADLLARISSDEVRVTGMHHGQREIVPGFHFAGLRIAYPFHDPSSDPSFVPTVALLLSRDVYLYSRGYLGEDDWLQGEGDALERFKEVLWSRLAVLKSDVLRFWPFEKAMRSRTGAPGRPTSRQLAEAEFRGRCERGVVEPSITREGEALSKWLGDTHPLEAQMKPKTISNFLRPLFREFHSAQK